MDAHHDVAARATTRDTCRRTGWLITSVVYAAIVLALATVVAGEAMGYRLIAIKSGSMRPAFDVGDLVVSRAVAPGEVRPGDIVTFRDPEFGQELVTHRVVSVRLHDSTAAFVTKGDANRAGERWSVPASGHVGREVAVVTGLGRILASTTPLLAISLIVVAAIALIAFVLRRIWALGEGHARAS